MRRFFSSLPPGVRRTLLLLAVFYAGALILSFLSVVNLSGWLALNAVDFWHGRVWQLASYVLLPANALDFLFNCLAFAMLAPRLEQTWSRLELGSFCLISALAAGMAKVCLMPHSPLALAGLATVNFGLLAAWLKLFGQEQVLFLGLWMMSVRQMILLIVALSFLQVVFPICLAGLLNLLTLLCGGLAAWLYLAVRWRRNLAVPAAAASSRRISRLEL